MVLLFIIGALFLAIVFTGWQAVRHLRQLEPGIRRGETGWVIADWGLGAALGVVASLVAIVLASLTFRL